MTSTLALSLANAYRALADLHDQAAREATSKPSAQIHLILHEQAQHQVVRWLEVVDAILEQPIASMDTSWPDGLERAA